MNLPPSVIIAFIFDVVCCVLLVFGFSMYAGVVGLLIMALSLYFGMSVAEQPNKK
jgi:hypothetical protein